MFQNLGFRRINIAESAANTNNSCTKSVGSDFFNSLSHERTLKSVRFNSMLTCRCGDQHIVNSFGILIMAPCTHGAECDATSQIDEQGSETSPKEIGEEGRQKQARPSDQGRRLRHARCHQACVDREHAAVGFDVGL